MLEELELFITKSKKKHELCFAFTESGRGEQFIATHPAALVSTMRSVKY